MRRALMIAAPLIVLLAAGAILGAISARNKYPIGPLAAFARNEETTFVPGRFSVDQPSLEVRVWLEGKDIPAKLPAYKQWLHNDLGWTVISVGDDVQANHGNGIVPDAQLHIDHQQGDRYLLYYTRSLNNIEALVDARLYKNQDFNSPPEKT